MTRFVVALLALGLFLTAGCAALPKDVVTAGRVGATIAVDIVEVACDAYKTVCKAKGDTLCKPLQDCKKAHAFVVLTKALIPPEGE